MTDLTTASPPVPWEVRIGTDVLAPHNIIIVLSALVGGANHGWTGIGWGLVAALFASVIPTVFIRIGVRRQRLTDKHVGDRQQRIPVIAFILASVIGGTILMAALGAPREILALLIAMFATLAVVVVITHSWKVSVHTAVASGAVVMLAVALTPWWFICYPLVFWIGWSRIQLRDHTAAQTIVGAFVGAVAGGMLFALLR
jgi:membrane-associated phospholipid phosphatase